MLLRRYIGVAEKGLHKRLGSLTLGRIIDCAVLISRTHRVGRDAAAGILVLAFPDLIPLLVALRKCFAIPFEFFMFFHGQVCLLHD